MFDNSKINHSNLTSSEPTVNYGTTDLVREDFKLRYSLNPANPVYNQVISELERQNVPYKIVPIEDDKEHIWIKTNK